MRGLSFLILASLLFAGSVSSGAESDPTHMAAESRRPVPWPDGIIPYDISKLDLEQQITVKNAMQRWMDTGARIAFVPRKAQTACIYFTGRTDVGNNTSQTGFKRGVRADINITAFWWKQGEWMPAHELGHVLGLQHEHARWDRDKYVTIHYENIKPGRSSDYDWIPKTNWLVASTPYDYYSIMHYRVCWASRCESQCRDADGQSPCAVIDPVGTNFDRVIGQWSDNRISLLDGERIRLAYGAGFTVYVSQNKKAGNGTLLKPYGNLADARRAAPKKARFILLRQDGSYSCSP
jgi:hypothetical protein